MDGSMEAFHEIEIYQEKSSAEKPSAITNEVNIKDNANPAFKTEAPNYLPTANLTRIMRRIIPTHAKISDAAKESMRKCAAAYISFITTEASGRCLDEKRRTVTPEDILWSLHSLGFEDYIEPLTVFLEKYRESEGDFRVRERGGPPVVKKASVAGTSVDVADHNLVNVPNEYVGGNYYVNGGGDVGTRGRGRGGDCSYVFRGELESQLDHFAAFGEYWGRREGEDGNNG